MTKETNKTIGIFAKLFLIFISLAIFVFATILIGYYYSSDKPKSKSYRTTLRTYARYIVKDLGSPPDFLKAKKLANDLNVVIAIKTPNNEFTSHSNVSIETISKKITKKKLRRFFTVDEHLFFRLKRNNIIYFIGIEEPVVKTNYLALFLALVFTLIFILLTYFQIQKLFFPLNEIMIASNHYAKGELSYKFPIKGDSLFNSLSQSLQNMAVQLDSLLKSKHQLLLAIAHEIRTPLTRIKLHLEFIEESDAKKQINDDINMISYLISDILEAERLKVDSHQFNKSNEILLVMINEIIEKYFINEKPFFEYKSNIDVELNVNKQQFLVVIKNLLSNAVKYRNDKPVDIILQKNSFSVINYGSEIPKEHLKHITDAFYRVDSSRQRASGGVGLGLFLVNEILKAHKFKLEIESNKTKTEFKVVFS